MKKLLGILVLAAVSCKPGTVVPSPTPVPPPPTMPAVTEVPTVAPTAAPVPTPVPTKKPSCVEGQIYGVGGVGGVSCFQCTGGVLVPLKTCPAALMGLKAGEKKSVAK